MTDRPIIFSAPMVRALLAGQKTQTRRLLKPQPMNEARYSGVHFASNEPDSWFFNSPSGPMKIPVRYEEGDRLWVREAHAFVGTSDPGLLVTRADYPACVLPHYENVPPADQVRWRPSIHMPRSASRLTLTVANARVRRLQEISEADAFAEGVKRLVFPEIGEWGWPQDRFRDLWNSIHGPDAWAANPWVVAITFSVGHGNIDTIKEPI